jgi:ABC-type multidrug transport system fused ATPase/permease subunit
VHLLGIYGFSTIVWMLLYVILAFFLGNAVRRSNNITHNELLNHVLHAPLTFFETNPMGRILNRFGFLL